MSDEDGDAERNYHGVPRPVWRQFRAEAVRNGRTVGEHMTVVLRERYEREE